MNSKYRYESLKNIDRIKIGIGTNYKVKKWRFPLTTICPEPKCRRICRTRELAISHYKVRHADNSVVCDVCEKPYSVKIFVSHFTDTHPGHILPIPIPQSTSQYSSAKRQSDQNYMVTLSDGNEWLFPRITWCPIRSCSENFMSRNDAMDHYMQIHTQTLVLCPLCDPKKPITNYVIPLHYATAHAGAEVPPDWKDQMKQECEVCHKMLSCRQSYLQHKATQHHIGKFKCPHIECDHTENERFRIETHWKKRHTQQTSIKNLYNLGKFRPSKLDTMKQVWPSKVTKRKRARRVTRSTTESSVASTSSESDSTVTTARTNRTDSDASRTRKKKKRASIIDDPKLFLESSVQLTRLSLGKWTVQSNVPEEETEAPVTAASAQKISHEERAVQANTVREEGPVLAASSQPNVQVNDSAQIQKPFVQSTAQPLISCEPQAGSSQNFKESVFIKTEQPDYLDDVTVISDTETEDDDDVILICD